MLIFELFVLFHCCVVVADQIGETQYYTAISRLGPYIDTIAWTLHKHVGMRAKKRKKEKESENYPQASNPIIIGMLLTFFSIKYSSLARWYNKPKFHAKKAARYLIFFKSHSQILPRISYCITQLGEKNSISIHFGLSKPI